MPLTYNRVVMAKVETTYGTSAAPAGTTDVIRVMNDLKLMPLDLGIADRDILYPYVGARPRYVTQKMAQIDFSFELSGSGTAGTIPRTDPLFRAAGYAATTVAATSVTYSPIGASYEGITIDCRHGGKKHLLVGVRGNIDLELKVGAQPMAKFSGIGFYATPTDTANGTLTFGAQADPIFVNSDNTPTVSVLGYAACLDSFTLKGGRSPKLHQRAGCTKQVRIDTERKAEGEVLIESTTMTAKDWFTPAANQTTGAISIVHGTTAGNIFTFSAPTCSIGNPEYDDGDGVEMLKLPFVPLPTAGNGYDDYTLAFT